VNRSEYFWPKVDKDGPNGCWLWRASTTRKGYGLFWIGHTHVPAHRYAYELLVGPIPEGLQLDHLCRVRNCVNPEHLEPVTGLTNARRGIAGAVSAARQRAKTHCPYGHEYSPENTRIDKSGWRQCRACKRQFRGARRPLGWAVKMPSRSETL
jgi:hypothetical protein